MMNDKLKMFQDTVAKLDKAKDRVAELEDRTATMKAELQKEAEALEESLKAIKGV